MGVTNLTASDITGKTSVVHPYHQLIPQDMNDDGVIEVPCPDESGTGNDTLAYWVQYGRLGRRTIVAQTYHCQSGGWYYQVPDNWQGHVTAESVETVAGENQVTLYVSEEPVLSLYTITNENRESRAEMGSRILLRRQPGTVYAVELYEKAARYGLDIETVKENFHMTVSAWEPSNS